MPRSIEQEVLAARVLRLSLEELNLCAAQLLADPTTQKEVFNLIFFLLASRISMYTLAAHGARQTAVMTTAVEKFLTQLGARADCWQAAAIK